MVNKKAAILLIMLVLFTWVASTRWDIKVYDDGRLHFMTDKISAQKKVLVIPKKEDRFEVVFGNKYLLHGTTAILYTVIGVTTIAVIIEARRKDES